VKKREEYKQRIAGERRDKKKDIKKTIRKP
jgi:hypothetical protein